MSDTVGNDHPALRSFWHPVAWSSEVLSPSGSEDAALVATQLLGQPLVLLRSTDGDVRVFYDECPHRGAPISAGHCNNNKLVCGFHGWQFDINGQAVLVPSLGPNAPIPGRARLGQPANICEMYGLVWVALDPPRLPIPKWLDGDDGKLGAFRPTAHTSRVLAVYQTDNLLDASHFGFLHSSLAQRNPLIEPYELIDQHDLGFCTALRKVAADNQSTEGWLRYTLAAPFTVLLRSEEPDGALRQSFFQAIQPIDQHHTRLFFMVRVPETDPDILEAMLHDEERVQQEDLQMTAAQRRTGMSVIGGPDLHVRSDRNGVLYRQTLRHMVGLSETAQPLAAPEQ